MGIYEPQRSMESNEMIYKYKEACGCQCLLDNGNYLQKSKMDLTNTEDYKLVMNRTEFNVEEEYYKH